MLMQLLYLAKNDVIKVIATSRDNLEQSLVTKTIYASKLQMSKMFK